MEEHLEILRRLHDELIRQGLRVHPQKSRFFFEELEYLGHNISQRGTSPTQAKVQAIRDLPVPTNVHELRQVLGLCQLLPVLHAQIL